MTLFILFVLSYVLLNIVTLSVILLSVVILRVLEPKANKLQYLQR